MGNCRVQAETKKSSTLPSPTSTLERSHLLQRNPDENDRETIQTKSCGYSGQTSTLPLGHSFGQVSAQDFSVPIQPKLTIGQPNDPYEQEADRVADEVMQMPDPKAMEQGLVMRSSKSLVQRNCAGCEEKEIMQMQRLYSSTIINSTHQGNKIENRLNNSKGSGSSLSPEVRTFMEPRFGVNFGHVNIHTDSEAVQLNRALGAQAFAYGSDIYFGAGTLPANNHLTAHELTHVVQQTSRFQTPVIQNTLGVQQNYLSGEEHPIVRRDEDKTVPAIQRKVDDGHDLRSSRFHGDKQLERTFDGEQYIAYGSSGEHVVKLQQALVDIGFELPKYGVDGLFRGETKSAVVEFQQNFGLKVDGIVGTETLGVLDDIFSSKNGGEEVLDEKDTDVLDGDSGEGPTFPVGEYSISQTEHGLNDNVSQEKIQLAPLNPPPTTAKPSSISKITINLKAQQLSVLLGDGKSRGPFPISSGKGCPNTEKDPCPNNIGVYCTPSGDSFEVEGLGGKDYTSSQGDKMAYYVAFVSARGIGIHNSQTVTGAPQSHGCVRVSLETAKFIHDNVTKQTIIKVEGKAPTTPWKKNKEKAKKSHKECFK